MTDLTHETDDTHESDWTIFSMVRDRLATPLYEAMTEWIDPPAVGSLLDVGCGTGGLLAQVRRVQPNLTLVAVDENPEVLPLVSRAVPGVTTITGDILDSQTARSRFDIIVARSVVHHLPDQIAGIRVLADRVAQGGTLILGEGGLAMSVLPHDIGHGRPGLDGRLRVASDRWFDKMRSELDGAVSFPYGWRMALEAAGFTVTAARTFIEEYGPPANDDIRRLVRMHLDRYLRDTFEEWLAPDDTETVRWLLDHDNQDGVDHRSDLHVLAGYTLWKATPQGRPHTW